MHRRSFLVLAIVGCTPSDPILAPPPDGVGARELIGVPTVLDASTNDVALHGPWAAVSINNAVQMWRRSPLDGAWAKDVKLDAPTNGAFFGSSIALDAGRLVVAANGEDVAGLEDAGAVYVYRYDVDQACGSSWCAEATLTAATPVASGHFGNEDVAVDGDRILVGARVEGPSATGAAYVFDRDPTGLVCGAPWCQTQKLRADNSPVSARFGRFVALDGNRLVVGADNESAVYVFDRDGTGTVCGQPWCRTQRVVTSDAGPGDGFGTVALQGDRLVVGASLKANTGRAYVFDRDPTGTVCGGARWCQSAIINNPVAGGGDAFGSAVAISGGTIAIGRSGGDVGGSNTGDVRLFEKRGSTWTAAGILAAPSPTSESYFGTRLWLDDAGIVVRRSNTTALLFSLMPRGPGTLVDPTLGIAVVNDTLGAGEYPVFSAGIGTGFGDVVGLGSRLYLDSNECGALAIGVSKGPDNFNDQLVMYIDAEPGGITTTASLTDTADPLRRAISGTDGAKRATLTFPSGFTPDHAIAVDTTFAGLWSLSTPNDLPFLRAPTGAGPSSITDGSFELGLTLADLGVPVGGSFRFMTTYLNSDDDLFRSDELHGVEPTTVGANPGTSTVTLAAGDFSTFVAVAPTLPATRPDTATVEEGDFVDIAIASNDTDLSGIDAASVEIVTGPAYGTLETPGSPIRYIHGGGEEPTDTFTYTIADSCGNRSAATTVTITVTPYDDPPMLVEPSGGFEADEDVTVRLPSYGVDDPDTTVLQLTLTVSHGTLALDTTGLTIDAGGLDTATITVSGAAAALDTALGTVDYTGDPDFFGDDAYALDLTDGTGSDNATQAFTVRPINDAPVVGVHAGWTLDEGATHVIATTELAGNDVDDADSAIRFVIDTAPARGTIRVGTTPLGAQGAFTMQDLRDGVVRYAHDGTETTSDSVIVVLTDDDGLAAAPVTVPIVIDPVNDPPRASADGYAIDEDDVLTVVAPGVLGNDTDADSAMTAALVTSVAHGTLALAPDGSFEYTPTANHAGPDAFTYEARDGSSASATTTVTLTVTPVNDAPDATADAYTVTEDQTRTVAAPGVLGNDTDVEGDAFTAHLVDDVTHGILALEANGSFIYTPAADYVGTDRFTYRARDTEDGAAVEVVLTVEGTPDAPVGVADAYDVDEDDVLVVAAPGVLANDSDADGDPLTATLGTNVANGTLALEANGSFTYTPTAGFTGADGFTYTASDGTSSTAAIAVTLTVDPVADPPVAVADAYEVVEGQTLVVAAPGVLANDTDPDGDTLTATLGTDAARGTLALAADGSFTYTPADDFTGDDAFTYTAADATQSSAPATVTITVTRDETDTGTDDTARDDTVVDDEPGRCGCSSTGSAAPAFLPLLLLVMRRRRRPGEGLAATP